ncbi:MAG TPA: hypothetical protein VF487_00155 [Chitinophagaceae bacterium]
MKKILFCLAFGVSALVLTSCEEKKSETKKDEVTVSSVPAPVQSAFSAKYSTAADVKWEEAHENNKPTYKAKFTVDGKKMKAEFDQEGVFIKESEDN